MFGTRARKHRQMHTKVTPAHGRGGRARAHTNTRRGVRGVRGRGAWRVGASARLAPPRVCSIRWSTPAEAAQPQCHVACCQHARFLCTLAARVELRGEQTRDTCPRVSLSIDTFYTLPPQGSGYSVPGCISPHAQSSSKSVPRLLVKGALRSGVRTIDSAGWHRHASSKKSHPRRALHY